MLAVAVRANVVGGSVRRLDSHPTVGRYMCSDRAATRVNDLKAQKRCKTRNMHLCRYFVSFGKPQQSMVPLLHGGGRGFESLDSTPKIFRFAIKREAKMSDPNANQAPLCSSRARTEPNIERQWRHGLRPRLRRPGIFYLGLDLDPACFEGWV